MKNICTMSDKVHYIHKKKRPFQAKEPHFCVRLNLFLRLRNQYIPPMPPPIPPAFAGSGSGRSATTLSVVSRVAATDAAF